MTEAPLNPGSESPVPGERTIDRPELPRQGYSFSMAADTETVEGEGQLKLGKYRHFEIYCDEPARIGGNDAYPPPLAYIAMGVGF